MERADGSSILLDVIIEGASTGDGEGKENFSEAIRLKSINVST